MFPAIYICHKAWALGLEIRASDESQCAPVRRPSHLCVVSGLTCQPLRHTPIDRDAPNMSAFNLTPGHIRQPVSVWRVRWVDLPNYLFEQHTRLIPALRHINASKAGEGQQCPGRTHRCGMDTPNSNTPTIEAKEI